MVARCGRYTRLAGLCPTLRASHMKAVHILPTASTRHCQVGPLEYDGLDELVELVGLDELVELAEYCVGFSVGSSSPCESC